MATYGTAVYGESAYGDASKWRPRGLRLRTVRYLAAVRTDRYEAKDTTPRYTIRRRR